MKIYICATGRYAVMNQNYIQALFSSLLQAVSYVRAQNQKPIFTWEA